MTPKRPSTGKNRSSSSAEAAARGSTASALFPESALAAGAQVGVYPGGGLYRDEVERRLSAMMRSVCQLLEVEMAVLILVDEVQDGGHAPGQWVVRKTWVSEAHSTGAVETAEGMAPSASIQWSYQVIPSTGAGLLKECLRTGQIICFNDVHRETGYDPAWDAPDSGEVRSLLYVPLVLEDQGHPQAIDPPGSAPDTRVVLGALQAINKSQGEFTPNDEARLSTLAALAADAIHGLRLNQELKIARADLEASRWESTHAQETLLALLENLPVSLYLIDPAYTLATVNAQRAQFAGGPLQTLVGRRCYQALFGRSQPCPECRVAETLQDGATTQRFERRWRDENQRNEEPSEWDIHTYPVYDSQNRIVQALLLEQDITEKRRLEAILTQSEKLAAVGQLAAGVAHEINNPLTAIIANAQILHRELPPNDDMQESVELIARAGARAAQVVRNLLDFARKEQYSLSITDINETLRRALELIQHEVVSRGARLEYQPTPDLPAILASPDQMQSVWLNLLLNAIDSLDKSPSEIKITTAKVGDEIHIAVSDNGKGIPAESLTRIFEPFYTTKAPGRGTGLGLAVSHRIISRQGGHIRVESQMGAGSTFTVVLPIS